MSGYRKTLLLVITVVTSQVFSTCPLNNYHDPHTGRCHPCSDCDAPRTPNQFCLKDCPRPRQSCEAGKYFDEHTKNCHLCTECKPPRTPNEFCQQQCTDDEKHGRTTTASVLPQSTPEIMPLAGQSADSIIIIVLCTVMGAVVSVLAILGVLYWKNCLCRDKHQPHTQVPEHEQLREPFIGQGTNNGHRSVNIEMQSLPALRHDEPQETTRHNFSLPVQHRQLSSSNICTNNQNNSLRQGEDSVELVDDRDRTASGTALGSAASAPSPLVETSTRLLYSLSRDRSLKGNVVCHPENEELGRCQFLPSVCQGASDAAVVHGMLSPSSTRDAEQPHLSFDPNKDCGYEDNIFPNYRSNHGSETQTSLKSSC